MRYFTFALLNLLQCWTITTHGSPVKETTDAKDFSTGTKTLLFTGPNDIVDLGLSINMVTNPDNKEDHEKIVFFIEAEQTESEERRSLFVYRRNGVRTKLLDNARGISVVNATRPVYFGAKDGIYIFNETENTATKFGTVNDEVVSVVGDNNTGAVYYLNKDHQLYKVTEEGRKSSIIDAVKGAEDITVDNEGHVYYYTRNKTIYVYSADNDSVRKIEVPYNISKLNFVQNHINDYGSNVFFRDDDKFYTIYGRNATAQLVYTNSLTHGATAVSGDLMVLILYANEKKIYAYDVLGFIIKKILENIF